MGLIVTRTGTQKNAILKQDYESKNSTILFLSSRSASVT